MKMGVPKWCLWTGIALSLLLAIALLSIPLILPPYVEGRLIPQLAAALELNPDQVRVRRVGWWGADLGPLRLARDGEGVSIRAIQIDYSPLSLLQREVTGLTVVGLEVGLTISADAITLAGQTLSPTGSAGEGEAPPRRLDTLLPIRLQRLSIVHARLRLDWSGQRLLLPLEVQLNTGHLPDGVLTGQAKLSLVGTTITLDGEVDQRANRAACQLTAEGVDLRRLAARIPPMRPLDLMGRADLDGRLTADLHPARLAGLALTAHFTDARVSTPQGQLETVSGTPLVMTLSGSRPDHLQWRCAPFKIGGPVALAVTDGQGELRVDRGGWSLTGTLDTQVPQQRLAHRAALDNDVNLAWTFQVMGGGTADADITFDLQQRGGDPVSLVHQAAKLSLRPQQIQLSGRYHEGGFSAEAQLTAATLELASPQGQIRIPRLSAAVTATISPTASGRAAAISVQTTLPQVRAAAGDRSLHLPRVDVSLSGRARAQHLWQLSGRLRVTGGRLQAPDLALRAENLTIDLPLSWPPRDGADPGRLEIGSLHWRERAVGGVRGNLQQQAGALGLNLRHDNRLIQGMAVFLKGRIGWADTWIEARLPPHSVANAIDLGRFHPAAAGILASGRISAVAEVISDGAGLRGSGRLKLQQGHLRQTARNLHLEEIDLMVQLDDLLALKSAPQQRLQVARLRLGDIAAENLDVAFQLEDARALFIESAGLDWCQGRVNLAALRITAARAAYRLTLYCDRLNLAELLLQLGATEASGDGSVNGRIPIQWTKGQLIFENGFLYSTPGQTGSIRVAKTERLLAGLPPGSPQFTQLDIATEALKDYTYNWAKLTLLSEDAVLLLKLQLDGKPNRLLPFVYDQSLGQFKRVAGQGQADFKGISIDLNFRSPLNEIIHYKELLDTK